MFFGKNIPRAIWPGALKLRVVAILLAIMTTTGAIAQEISSSKTHNSEKPTSGILMSLNSEISFVVGTNADQYAPGGAVKLAGNYRLDRFDSLSITGGVDCTVLPLAAINNSFVTIFTPKAGVEYRLPIYSWLSILTELTGGYYIGFLRPTPAVQGAFELGTSLASVFHLSPAFALGIRGGYQWRVGLHHALSAGIYLSLKMGKPQ